MTHPQQWISEEGASQPSAILAAVQNVTTLCIQTQQEQSNPSIEYVLNELHGIKQAVTRAWPLPRKDKQQIDLGPFAAKNIEDWNEDLADALMKLDYTLQHDGDQVEKLLSPSDPGSASVKLLSDNNSLRTQAA